MSSMIWKGETITCVLGMALVHGFPNFYPNSEMLVKQTKQQNRIESGNRLCEFVIDESKILNRQGWSDILLI